MHLIAQLAKPEVGVVRTLGGSFVTHAAEAGGWLNVQRSPDASHQTVALSPLGSGHVQPSRMRHRPTGNLVDIAKCARVACHTSGAF